MTIAKLHQPDALADRSDGSVRCVACLSNDLTDFFEIKQLPVHVGMLHDSHEAAMSAPTGTVCLSYCHHCGLVHNQQFDQSLTHFAPGYEVGLQHSQVFRAFIEQVARRLIDKFDLRRKSLFEIGCGDGYFLRRICELGANQGVGIDPTVPAEHHDFCGDGSIQLIRDSFGEHQCNRVVDFICCLSVFEDIANPRQFLQQLHQMMDQRIDSAAYFEVFNAFRAFERAETWSIHYEQCNYFNEQSLRGLFERCGFEILDSGRCYQGDQYLFVEVRAVSTTDRVDRQMQRHDLPPVVADFSATYQRTKREWSDRLSRLRQRGDRVVLWGSGGKGISFLNALDTQDLIRFVVDINPVKHGRFIPGSGQQIVPLSFLAEYKPDTIIITNSLYEQEMRQQAKELGVNADFIVA